MDYLKFGLNHEMLVTDLLSGEYKMYRSVTDHIVRYELKYRANALLSDHTIAGVTTGTIQPNQFSPRKKIKFSFSLPESLYFMSIFKDASYIGKIRSSQKEQVISYFYDHSARRVCVFVVSNGDHFVVKIFNEKEIENTPFVKFKHDLVVVDFRAFQQRIDDFEEKVFGDGTD